MFTGSGFAIIGGLMLIPVVIGVGIFLTAIKLSDISRQQWELLTRGRKDRKKKHHAKEQGIGQVRRPVR